MPAEFIAGDLFQADLPALAHGCNCMGSMSGGIAVEFRRRWPQMYEEYRRRCEDGRFTLGEVFAWEGGDRVILNLATQHYPGADARLGAVEEALTKMVRIAEEKGVQRVGLPRIGAGIGGLEWADVRSVIEKVAASTSVELVVFEEYRRR